MERESIIGVPDKIRIEYYWVFPDEEKLSNCIGTVSGLYDDCLEGSPEDVYSKDYVDFASELIVRLLTQVSDVYGLGMIPKSTTCREYFNKYVPEHIELVHWNWTKEF